jgi:hypothetical protein
MLGGSSAQLTTEEQVHRLLFRSNRDFCESSYMYPTTALFLCDGVLSGVVSAVDVSQQIKNPLFLYKMGFFFIFLF